jgi:drug/metabolite transporter (DMT)-like permease
VLQHKKIGLLDYQQALVVLNFISLITAIVCLPFVIQSGVPNLKSSLFLLLVGIVSIGIPSILYSIGIRNVRALTTSFITMLEPVLNPV